MSDSYRVKLCSEARNFLLENSPNATFIMEELPTEAMKAKEDKEKEKARLVADIESHMKELQASLEQDNRKQAKEKAKVVLENLVADLQEWTQEKKIESESERAQMKEVVVRLMACLGEIEVLVKLEHDDVKAMISKTERVRYFLKCLLKRQRKEMEARYSCQLEEAQKTLFACRDSSFLLDKIIEILRENRSVTDHGVYNSKLLVLTLASQTSSSSTSIPKDRVEFEMSILIGFMKHFMENL